MKKPITPCFWYDNHAKDAAALYAEAFLQTKILSQSPIVTEISLSGQHFILLDGGPKYKPNPSISFYYICENEEEFNRAWNTLKKDGVVMMDAGTYPWSEKYGFLEDKYGISWQIALGDIKEVGQKITPCFMFTQKNYGRADEAVQFYASVFADSHVDGILRFGSDEAPDTEGKVKHAQMSIDGNKLMIMESAHPHAFTFSEGVSLTIYCDTQKEIDYYWEKLTESGAESMCGWLRDKFGVSWQIIPSILGKIMNDPSKAGKAAQAFMSMRKLEIEKIVQASL